MNDTLMNGTVWRPAKWDDATINVMSVKGFYFPNVLLLSDLCQRLLVSPFGRHSIFQPALAFVFRCEAERTVLDCSCNDFGSNHGN